MRKARMWIEAIIGTFALFALAYLALFAAYVFEPEQTTQHHNTLTHKE